MTFFAVPDIKLFLSLEQNFIRDDVLIYEIFFTSDQSIFNKSISLFVCASWCYYNDYYDDNGDDDNDIGDDDDVQNIHCRPSISLLATLLATRIFYYNPTRTLLEVKKPYSF